MTSDFSRRIMMTCTPTACQVCQHGAGAAQRATATAARLAAGDF